LVILAGKAEGEIAGIERLPNQAEPLKWLYLFYKQSFSDCYMQQRQSQPLPFILTLEQIRCPYRDVSPFSFMPCLYFCRQGCGVTHGIPE
jgi:hypothetical protein